MQKTDSLRKLRTALGYKQEAVAEYLGISQQSYSDMERNIICLNRETAEKLAVFYAVRLTEIYYDAGTLPLPAPDTEKELLQQLLTEKDKRLDEKDKRLDEKDKQIALLQQMLEEKKKK